MKSLVFALLLSPMALWAQDAAIKVPAPVEQAVKKLYPEASELSWEKKKERYKAEFKTWKVDHKMWLEASGAVVKHQYEIKKDQLPKPIADAIAKDFAGYTIDECDRTDENGESTYKVEVKNAQGKKNLHFSSDGKVMPKKSAD
jgi:hypothetical protein